VTHSALLCLRDILTLCLFLQVYWWIFTEDTLVEMQSQQSPSWNHCIYLTSLTVFRPWRLSCHTQNWLWNRKCSQCFNTNFS